MKRLLLVGLLLLVVGIGLVLKHRLSALEAETSHGGMADWSERIRADDAKARALQRALAQAKAAVSATQRASTSAAVRRPPTTRGLAGSISNRVRLALQDPDFRKRYGEQQRLLLDRFYGPLFAKLNLPTDELEKFKDLLVEMQQEKGDASQIAVDSGLDPATHLGANLKAVDLSLNDVNGEIANLLGPDGAAAYEAYEQQTGMRAAVAQLKLTLSYSADPLTSAQASKLLQALADLTPPEERTFANGVPIVVAAGLADGSTLRAPIPDAVVARAASFLTPAQVQALTELQHSYRASGK